MDNLGKIVGIAVTAKIVSDVMKDKKKKRTTKKKTYKKKK